MPHQEPKMKSIFALVFAIGVAVATVQEGIFFQPNHEFVFEYDTVAVTGLTAGARIYSGLRVKADVRVQFHGKPKCVVQIENPRIFHKNQEVSLVENMALHELPMDQFVEFVGPEAEELVHLLVKPVVFNYENGLVKDLQMVEGDKEWSMNIKKGIVNLIQMNLEGHQRLSESESGLRLKPIPRSSNDAFRVYEHGILGRCVHTYVNVPHSVNGEHMVKKVIDPSTCVELPEFFKSLIKTKKCGLEGCPHTTTEPITTDMEVTAILRKESPQKYLIKEVTAVSKVAYMASTEQAVVTFISQNLKLKEAKPIRSFINPQPTKVVPEGLKMTLWSAADWELQTKRFEKTMVDDILKQIPEIIGTEREMKLPKLLLKLITILKYAPQTDLEEIYLPYLTQSRFALSTAQKTVKKFLMDILPAIGTVNSYRVMQKYLEKIPTETLKNMWFTSLAPQALAMDTNPEIIEVMWAICKSPKIMGSKQLKADFWLSFSAWMNRVVTENKNGMTHAPRFVEIIRHLMTQSETEFDKILVLRCIGNTGLVDFVTYIQKYLMDPAVPKVLRINAIAATRLMAERVPRKIRTLLLPIFLNQNEVTEVRISAFHIIIATKPKTATINMIALAMNKERSIHVASFVYNYMWSWSQTTAPCWLRMAKDFAYALQFIRPIRSPLTLQYTKNMAAALCPMCKCPWFKGTIIGKLTCRASAGIDMIPSSESYIPEGVFTTINIPAFGREIPIELGVWQNGVQDLVSKVMTSEASFSKLEDLLKMFESPMLNLASAQDSLKALVKQLRLPVHATEDLKTLLFAKLYGYDLKMVEVNKEMIKGLLESSSLIHGMISALASGKSIDLQKTLLLENMVYRLPTLAGIPVTIDLKAIAHFHVRGEIQLKAEPQLLTANRLESLDGKIELTPKAMIKVHGLMGVSIPYLKAACAVNGYLIAKVPVAVKLTMDKETRKMRIEMPTLEMEHKVLDFIVEPASYVIKTVSNNVKYLKKPFVIPTPHWSKKVVEPTMVKTEFVSEILGLEISIKHTTPRPTSLNPVRATIRVRPTAQKPEKFALVATYKTGEEASRLPGAPLLSNAKQTKVELTLLSVGGPKPININFELVHQRVLAGLKSVLHMNLKGLNTLCPYMRSGKWCATTILLNPNVPELFYEPLSAETTKINHLSEIFRGNNCEEKLMTLNVFHKKSELQKRFEMSAYTEMPEYIQCKQDREAGRKTSFACARLMEILGELRTTEMKLTVEPNVLPTNILKYLNLGHQYVKIALFRNLHTRQATNEPNTITIIANREDAKMNAVLELPTTTETNQNIHLGSFFPFAPMHVSQPFYMMAWRRLQQSVRRESHVPVSEPLTVPQRICTLSPTEVKSSDGVIIPIGKYAGCEMLLAQDCSKLRAFAVIVKGIRDTTQTIVKVTIAGEQILIHPQNSTPLLINGVPKHISVGEHIIQLSPRLIKITREGQYDWKIECQKLGITVIYSGEEVIVMPSIHHYGRMCGICGNFNEEKYDELIRESKPLTYEKLIASYIIPGPGGECRPTVERSSILSQQESPIASAWTGENDW